ncbi:MAG: NAD(P)H-hydrate dehydratase, partial [Pseudomonadota bacterium]
LLASGKKALLDADALNHLANTPCRLSNVALTPHPGEAGRLLQQPTTVVNANRLLAANNISTQYGASVLLKGAGTVIHTDEGVFINSTGNPGMASGGMGDVLSGIVGGLMAQGLSPAAALIAGAWCHGSSADIAAGIVGEPGLTASDVIDHLTIPLKALQ